MHAEGDQLFRGAERELLFVIGGLDVFQFQAPLGGDLGELLELLDEVEALAAGYGYKTIYPEDYTIAEQLGIGAHAKHVIAVHGAAISLLLMNKKVDSVIELFPPNVHHELFPAALGEKVVRYEQIVPDFDPRIAHNGWQAILPFKSRNFSVNVTLLGRLLSEIH